MTIDSYRMNFVSPLINIRFEGERIDMKYVSSGLKCRSIDLKGECKLLNCLRIHMRISILTVKL
jgi:hypothetical protein